MRRSGESLAIGPAAESISARALRQISPKSAAIRMGPDGKHFYVRFSERGTTRQRRRPFLEPALAGYGGLSFALVEEQLASEIRALGWRLARRAAEGTLSRGDREALA